MHLHVPCCLRRLKSIFGKAVRANRLCMLTFDPRSLLPNEFQLDVIEATAYN